MTAIVTRGDAVNLHLPDEWQRIKGVRVLDPDGWRCADAPAWDEPISEDEFDMRAAMSTSGPWDWEQAR